MNLRDTLVWNGFYIVERRDSNGDIYSYDTYQFFYVLVNW
jgi:hypothetical protein